ncbi:Protein FAM214A [Sphaceloma murrayae]|uniref:Protein FAM214A n=1 Tax=Sphaceloma murrayae TaxID=2082308 RepID=A0A2K1QL56_9PEZI|nr:Protein FAM214A [Sphaceloma murrayae]
MPQPAVDTPTQTVKKESKHMNEKERQYAQQAERLGQYTAPQEDDTTGSTRAVEAKFITAQDPVIETANGGRLPAVPLDEAIHLNKLRDEIEGIHPGRDIPESGFREAKDGTIHGAKPDNVRDSQQSERPEAPLREQVAPSQTSPLFPPLPLYGPPTLLRTLQCCFFRTTSFFLSLQFLLVVVLGAAFTTAPSLVRRIWYRVTLRDPDESRPFYHEEIKRREQREAAEQDWIRAREHGLQRDRSPASLEKDLKAPSSDDEYIPTEGGPDPLICDVGYYARREGLDVETFQVQTEDGFIIELQHIYNPLTQNAHSAASHAPNSPTIFDSATSLPHPSAPKSRYPILMLHGLLQSSGAYTCTGPSSLAFYLHRAGYDVWLGNNRCGLSPRHTLLSYSDPRMWAWNIRQMGVLDLAALVSRVLAITSAPKLALVAHSQGTTQTLVALAKEQRPDLGEKISVFCALAPAAYAGPLIGKAYFKFMRVISPAMFKVVFGIHAFIPFMMTMHALLPGGFYGDMGYLVFSFLFNWSDTRWDKGLRKRCFQFAPTYVSAESMRWWLGRECFARQKCILATREEGKLEDREDEEEDEVVRRYYEGGANTNMRVGGDVGKKVREMEGRMAKEDRGRYAWYDNRFPPLAMWVCGADDLVDGRRLLRRFDRGREPCVRVVHKKIIEGYEHLDVIWAMDVVEKVGVEIKEVVWRTVGEGRERWRTPEGCEEVDMFDLSMEESGRPAQAAGPASRGLGLSETMSGENEKVGHQGPISPTLIQTTAGEWSEKLEEGHHAKNENENAS